MPRIGSGTTTDNTDTSNDLYFAGEIVSYEYDIRDGSRSTDPAVDLSGYTVEVSYLAMELNTAGDLSTAIKKSGSTVQNVTSTIVDGTDGKISVIIPANILKTVGFTLAPAIGSPLYMAYEVKYSKGTEASDIIESDIIGFRYSLSFDITA